MSWSGTKSSIQSDVSSIQNELLDIIRQLQQHCIGVGEAQLSRALNTLRDELQKARSTISQMQ